MPHTEQQSQHAAKPFLKWAGGKSQLLAQFDQYLPESLEERDFTYIEPFVGGGAMLFHMQQKFPNIKRVVINDINPHLDDDYSNSNLLNTRIKWQKGL